MLKKLAKIADRLDKLGFHTEADQIDFLMIKVAIQKQTAETIVIHIKEAMSTLAALSAVIQNLPVFEKYQTSMPEEYAASVHSVLLKAYNTNDAFSNIREEISNAFQWSNIPWNKDFYEFSIKLIDSIVQKIVEISDRLMEYAYVKKEKIPMGVQATWLADIQGLVGRCKDFLKTYSEMKNLQEISSESRGFPWPQPEIWGTNLPEEWTEEITKPSEDPESTGPNLRKKQKSFSDRLAEWLSKHTPKLF